ncbi:hypothetical protein A2U01_0040696, partial [Trifolium medium]|nr:hypothetical protein [Trifolium medium]
MYSSLTHQLSDIDTVAAMDMPTAAAVWDKREWSTKALLIKDEGDECSIVMTTVCLLVVLKRVALRGGVVGRFKVGDGANGRQRR